MTPYTPKHTPPLSAMLADIGQTNARVIAKCLGVSERTARYWLANDNAPRPAMLALFWMTSWGRDHINTGAVNDARMLASQVATLESENARLRDRVAYLERLNGYGSANAPTFTPAPSARAWPTLAAL